VETLVQFTSCTRFVHVPDSSGGLPGQAAGGSPKVFSVGCQSREPWHRRNALCRWLGDIGLWSKAGRGFKVFSICLEMLVHCFFSLSYVAIGSVFGLRILPMWAPRR